MDRRGGSSRTEVKPEAEVIPLLLSHPNSSIPNLSPDQMLPHSVARVACQPMGSRTLSTAPIPCSHSHTSTLLLPVFCLSLPHAIGTAAHSFIGLCNALFPLPLYNPRLASLLRLGRFRWSLTLKFSASIRATSCSLLLPTLCAHSESGDFVCTFGQPLDDFVTVLLPHDFM